MLRGVIQNSISTSPMILQPTMTFTPSITVSIALQRDCGEVIAMVGAFLGCSVSAHLVLDGTAQRSALKAEETARGRLGRVERIPDRARSSAPEVRGVALVLLDRVGRKTGDKTAVAPGLGKSVFDIVLRLLAHTD